nr:DNA helicase MCM8-like isoform X2 [Onthophagus taurus]
MSYKRKNSFNKFNSHNSDSKDIRESTPSSCNGFEGFYHYFNRTFLDNEVIKSKINHFKSYISKNNSLFSYGKIKEDGFFTIDYKEVLKDEFLNKCFDSLQKDLIENTEEILKCIGLAMHQTLCEVEKENSEYLIPIVHCRLINVEPVLNIKDVRVNRCNKLVAVKGAVIKTGDKQDLCVEIEFKCSQCEQMLIVKQNDGYYTTPNMCIRKGCRAQSKFKPLLASKYTHTINYQNIKIQEINDDDSGESARIPRSIPCLLENDLVSSCILGDDVTIVGVVKTESSPTNYGFKKKSGALYDIYIKAISVINEKTSRQQQNSFSVSPKITFITSDYYQIEKIHSEENLFRLLVHSLCPNIYGHEIIKAGLLLSLFGGTENVIEKRKECHVLLMGDPGLGKSQMLQACCNIAPGGVYVCGNTSTGAGLTVTVNRESRGEYTLEAGALVLADQGCCCIDEFDKGPSQNSSLLEVMEQQSISIAKAGISRNIPTRTTILAAANPIGGHYNHSKTVIENLKINSALLSRFDLIFILLDRSDEKSDVLLSEHVLALHTNKKTNHFSKYQIDNEATSSKKTSLKELLIQPNEELDLIPHSLVRKYIAYAQKYVKPQLNAEAKVILEEFYLDLRSNRNTSNFTPVTARQLESLKRLTQARAKLELREEATAEDALEVIEIIKYSIASVAIDENGSFDYGRSPNGTGISGRKQVSKFLSLLEDISKSNESKMFSLEELRNVAAQAGVAKNRFYNTIQILNLDGVLLKKPDNMYQLVNFDV